MSQFLEQYRGINIILDIDSFGDEQVYVDARYLPKGDYIRVMNEDEGRELIDQLIEDGKEL